MARGKSVFGTCHICSAEGKLTFEHVPPAKAFNNQRLIKAPFENVLNADLDSEIRGKIEQRGAGAYTLCERCNNDTGSWYANDFIGWTYQAMEYLLRSNGQTTLAYPFHIFPLRVIKQIITMFFSVNSPRFAMANPELVRFVKNKEQQFLNPKYKIFGAFMKGRAFRRSGVSSIIRFSDTSYSTIILSEIAFPPFVYVLTLDSPCPSHLLTDITWFANYKYNDFDIVYPKFNTVPVHLFFPGDYRTRKEILNDYERNTMGLLEE